MKLNESQKSLQVELQRRYDRGMAWASEVEGRVFCSNEPTNDYIVELAERGISSIEEYDLDEDRCTLSDRHKEVWGFRLRNPSPWEMSREQVDEAIEALKRQSARA